MFPWDQEGDWYKKREHNRRDEIKEEQILRRDWSRRGKGRDSAPLTPLDIAGITILALFVILVLMIISAELGSTPRKRVKIFHRRIVHGSNLEDGFEESWNEEDFEPPSLENFNNSLPYFAKHQLNISKKCLPWIIQSNHHMEACFFTIPNFWRPEMSSFGWRKEEKKSKTQKQKVCQTSNQEDVCPSEIATQMSIERLNRLHELPKEWDGYISVSVFSSAPESDLPLLNSVLLSLPCSQSHRLAVHLVVGSPTHPYPINYMRNLAFEYGFGNRCDSVCIYDIDFIPSPNLCNVINQWTNVNDLPSEAPTSPLLQPQQLPQEGKTASPSLRQQMMHFVPSFEYSAQVQETKKKEIVEQNEKVFRSLGGKILGLFSGDSSQGNEVLPIPRTKEALYKIVEKEGTAERFHAPFEGQDIDLERWWTASSSYVHSPISLSNEHYVWFSRSAYSSFANDQICDEAFFDRGYNKIMCYLKLRVIGFTPVAIPNGWLFHFPEGNVEESGVVESVSNKKEPLLGSLPHRRPSPLFYKRLFHHQYCLLISTFGWLKISPICQWVCNNEKQEWNATLWVPFGKARRSLQYCYEELVSMQGLNGSKTEVQLKRDFVRIQRIIGTYTSNPEAQEARLMQFRRRSSRPISLSATSTPPSFPSPSVGTFSSWMSYFGLSNQPKRQLPKQKGWHSLANARRNSRMNRLLSMRQEKVPTTGLGLV